LIIDSCPIKLCENVRKFRAKNLREMAEIGYNAAKEEYFYGLKLHILTDKNGKFQNGMITGAKVHDVKALEDLLFSNIKTIIGDKGYISKKLKERLAKKGIKLITPSRKNMEQIEQNDGNFLFKIRKIIETYFSKLKEFCLKNLYKVRSFAGLISRLNWVNLFLNWQN
jgi:IS5 family transposase